MLAGCDEVLDGVSAVYLNFPDKATRVDFCHQAVFGRKIRRCRQDPQPSGVPNTAHCLRLSQLWYALKPKLQYIYMHK